MSDYMIEETTGRQAVRYKSIVVAIHWITAAFVLTQIYLGFAFGDYPKGSPERTELFTWHRSVGVLILFLALIRLAVRLMNPPPPYPEDLPKWERAVAVWSHRLFYVLLVALPLTGLMLVSKGGATTKLVGGLSFPTVPLPFGELHELLAFSLIGLLGLHAGAALKQ
ncbi:MAG: cytochrome b/b6 domain-containing protein, partial [Tepidisphaeraceae bacterium]